MEYLATFLEGIVTFVSPCLLPMLPLYLAYFAGSSNAAVGEGVSEAGRTRRVLVRALGFILGFTLVFIALGALAGTFGRFLTQYGSALNIVCGIIVIVFGLQYAGFIHIPFLEKTLKPQASVQPETFFAAMVFGIVFSIGWTPCVGVFLGSALAIAAVGASAVKGVLLLLCYSMGLAIPFLISAVAIDRVAGAFTVIKKNYKTINLVCGLLLVVMGVLLATGLMGTWLQSLGTLF